MYKIFKRCFDFTSATLLLIVISPIFIVLMILVRIKHGSPVFFRQQRTGKDFKPFMLMKFRTMSNATDSEGNLLPDNQRVTKFGLWLRNSSLDELPELINIIKGDMAVIGPRPLIPQYDPYYTEREKLRFTVRGGLIPPESLHTDSFITWDKQLEYEASYAENLSLVLDAKILISVFKTMLERGERDYGGYERKSLIEERDKRNE
ncbi:MAG: sugar transferase [Bacteroidaceae bacterium]|nr:sugar transferase [Bacteroidaceae bacterium]